jgi:hypothetical protein
LINAQFLKETFYLEIIVGSYAVKERQLTPLILVTWEAEIGRIIFCPVSSKKKKKKACKSPSQEKKSWARWHTCHPSDYRKHKLGGSWSRLAWAKNKTLSPK